MVIGFCFILTVRNSQLFNCLWLCRWCSWITEELYEILHREVTTITARV